MTVLSTINPIHFSASVKVENATTPDWKIVIQDAGDELTIDNVVVNVVDKPSTRRQNVLDAAKAFQGNQSIETLCKLLGELTGVFALSDINQNSEGNNDTKNQQLDYIFNARIPKAYLGYKMDEPELLKNDYANIFYAVYGLYGKSSQLGKSVTVKLKDEGNSRFSLDNHFVTTAMKELT